MTGKALICLGVLVYTYSAYPVLIAALARFSPIKVLDNPEFLPTVGAVSGNLLLTGGSGAGVYWH